MEIDRVAGKGQSSFQSFIRNLGASILYAFARSGSEEPKVIVSRSLWIAVLRCTIHILPIGVTAYLAYLNISGYFIGDQLIGGAGSNARNILLIQLAAKVMELLVVASLTAVVVNLIRHQALQKDGIPFGLLSAGFRFSSLAFLWSPAYILGCLATKSWVKRLGTALFLALCGLVAVTCGPSTALLMIPTRQSSWYAGGTDFWLIGKDDSLWPDTLNRSHVGGSMCLNPTQDNLTDALLSTSGCIWHGYTILSEGLKDRHFDFQSNISINDGVIKRTFTRLQLVANSVETWVYGPHVATARISRILADAWGGAVSSASSAQSHKRYSNLKNATAGLGAAHVDSWIPVCRVACANYNNIGSDLSLNLGMWKMPEFAPATRGKTDLVTVGVDFPDSSQISTHWINIPSPTPEHHLTAGLMIRIPYAFANGAVERAAAFTCSVDARWARGTNVGNGLPNTDNMVVSGRIKTIRPPGNITMSYLPATAGPDWRFVSVTSDWLRTLIPPLKSNDTGNYTTLADSFAAAGFDNSTGVVSGSFASLGATIESTVATWFVDGMSRVGLSANGGNMFHVMPDRYQWLTFLPEKANNTPGYLDRILKGETIIAPPPSVPASSLTKLSWSVTVAGLAYKASTTPTWLAIGVLFTHALIAGFQVVYMLTTRRSSDAWESLEELLILMLQSKPSKSIKVENTSAGIWRGGVMQLKTRIVVRDEDEWVQGKEVIQVLVDPDSRSDNKSALIQPGKVYGACEAVGGTAMLRSTPYRRRDSRGYEDAEVVELVSHPNYKGDERLIYRS